MAPPRTTFLLPVLPLVTGYTVNRYSRDVSEDGPALYTSSHYVEEVADVSRLPPSTGIKDNTITVVNYYAHWCPHCRHFKRPFESFIQKVDNTVADGQVQRASQNSKAPQVNFQAIDCAIREADRFCRKQDIRGFPTIRMYSPRYPDGIDIGQEDVDQTIKEEQSFIELHSTTSTVHNDAVITGSNNNNNNVAAVASSNNNIDTGSEKGVTCPPKTTFRRSSEKSNEKHGFCS